MVAGPCGADSAAATTASRSIRWRLDGREAGAPELARRAAAGLQSHVRARRRASRRAAAPPAPGGSWCMNGSPVNGSSGAMPRGVSHHEPSRPARGSAACARSARCARSRGDDVAERVVENGDVEAARRRSTRSSIQPAPERRRQTQARGDRRADGVALGLGVDADHLGAGDGEVQAERPEAAAEVGDPQPAQVRRPAARARAAPAAAPARWPASVVLVSSVRRPAGVSSRSPRSR